MTDERIDIKEQIAEVARLPDVFLEYQKELMRATDQHSVVFVEKSRRIGATWGIGADAVLTSAANKAAGGMNTFYIGFNLDMTREFIDTCAGWAKAFSHVASEVEEFVFKDDDGKGNTKEIQAFRIKFDSGFSITALTSRPRSLRGRQGYIIIDEAAFHDDLKELMKAALAMLIWGGKVLVISTHDGADNVFNEYIQDAHAGRNNYHIIRIDFDQALEDGLYERICFVTEKDWSDKAEAEWRAEIIDFYGEGADEELFCIPRMSAGTYFPSALVEKQMVLDTPVLRYEQNDEFKLRPEFERERAVSDWCEENIKPLISLLDPSLGSVLGEDFGRSGDLTVLAPQQIGKTLVRTTPFVVELRNVPFTQQKQILWYILDRLPKLSGVAMDARGNGQQMAEETAQRYGSGLVHEVMTGPNWYLDSFPKYRAALEDGLVLLPRDSDILQDHRAAVIKSGIPQISDKRTKGKDKGQRHGDALIAFAMAYWVSLQDNFKYGYISTEEQKQYSSLRRPEQSARTFGMRHKGAW